MTRLMRTRARLINAGRKTDTGKRETETESETESETETEERDRDRERARDRRARQRQSQRASQRARAIERAVSPLLLVNRLLSHGHVLEVVLLVDEGRVGFYPDAVVVVL